MDVLKHLSTDLVSRGIKNRMNTLTNHLLSQSRHVILIWRLRYLFPLLLLLEAAVLLLLVLDWV